MPVRLKCRSPARSWEGGTKLATIINLRGCSGSGKTWVVRAVAGHFDRMIPLGASIDRPHGYELSGNSKPITYLVGSYGNVCGGCDTIKTQDDACGRVRGYAGHGNVIFEGLMISTIFERYRALDRELTAAGHRYIWAFLDTPLDLCLERVQQRRNDRSDARPFDPKLTTAKWELMRSIEFKARHAGLETAWVPSNEEGAATVLRWLREGV